MNIMNYMFVKIWSWCKQQYINTTEN